jgi:uncharacterized Fe-S cluster protein YjdI
MLLHRFIHADKCIRNLSTVFNNIHRRWVVPSAASADEIANVIVEVPERGLRLT